MTIEGRNARTINVEDDDEALAIIEVVEAGAEALDLSDFGPRRAAKILEVVKTIQADLG